MYIIVNAAINIRENSNEIPQLRQALNNEMNQRKDSEAKNQELLKQIEQHVANINRLEYTTTHNAGYFTV